VSKGSNDDDERHTKLEEELQNLKRLFNAQRDDMKIQHELNVQIRRNLSKMLSRRCEQCSVDESSSELENMIRKIDQMNIRIKSYLESLRENECS